MLRQNPGDAVHKKFRRSYDSLEEIFEFVQEFFKGQQIDTGNLYTVKFTLEELFTNMVKYNPGNTNDILIDLDREDDTLRVVLTDFDVEPFDINKLGDVRVDQPVEERRPGGLGIHLVKKLAERIDYEYEGRRGRTTVIIKLG